VSLPAELLPLHHDLFARKRCQLSKQYIRSCLPYAHYGENKGHQLQTCQQAINPFAAAAAAAHPAAPLALLASNPALPAAV
jgi:hypothetical protein